MQEVFAYENGLDLRPDEPTRLRFPTGRKLRILVEKGKMTATEADRIRSGGSKTSEEIEAFHDAIDDDC